MAITIDGIVYDVAILKLDRSFESLDHYAERTLDGVLHRGVIGIFYNYDVVVGMSAYNTTDYAAFYLKISEPEEFHTVSIPGENSGNSWYAYISKGKDEVIKLQKGGINYYRGLSFSIIAKSPSRTPS